MNSTDYSNKYGTMNIPPYAYGDTGFFALGSIRNPSYAFEVCCKTPGQGYQYKDYDPACYRYCNLTESGLTAATVKSCFVDLVNKIGNAPGYGIVAVNGIGGAALRFESFIS